MNAWQRAMHRAWIKQAKTYYRAIPMLYSPTLPGVCA